MARIIQPNSFSLIFLFYQFARKVNMGMIYFLVMLHGANVAWGNGVKSSI